MIPSEKRMMAFVPYIFQGSLGDQHISTEVNGELRNVVLAVKRSQKSSFGQLALNLILAMRMERGNGSNVVLICLNQKTPIPRIDHMMNQLIPQNSNKHIPQSLSM